MNSNQKKNKQSMKLYTEEQVMKIAKLYRHELYVLYAAMKTETPIELPSDEEIKTYLNNHSYEFEHGFKDAIEFIKNKIQGTNK